LPDLFQRTGRDEHSSRPALIISREIPPGIHPVFVATVPVHPHNSPMPGPQSNEKPKSKKGPKHWALFCLRWGIAVVGVYIVLSQMSLHDRVWAILDSSNRPQQVSLAAETPENAPVFALEKGGTVAADHVVNEPYTKTAVLNLADRGGQKVYVVGLDLAVPLNKSDEPKPRRLLVSDDAKTGPCRWVDASAAPDYVVKVPYPKVQVGLIGMIHAAKPGLLWAALLVFPITFLITSYRWHELLKVLDIHIGQTRTFVLNMVGAFYNTFMPGSTGGDALKAWYVSKQTPHRTRAVMSVLVDRAVGLLALIILGGVTASFQWQITESRNVSIAAGVICLCVVIGMAVFYIPILHKRSGLDFFLKKLPMQKQVRGAVDTMQRYGQRPWLGLWALIVSFPVHGAVITSAMFAGMAFGLPLHLGYYWVCVPVIVLAGALPLSPQGAGVMEGFAVLLTRSQGVTVGQAFALTMSIRVVQILWNLSGGLFVLRGNFHSPNAAEKQELDPDDDLRDGPGEALPVAV
jgi:uncharacterized protein (TIRG00374 family)